ncbi:MAG: hypothetical protein AABX47_03405 [Nanoarchaeota archaeon]
MTDNRHLGLAAAVLVSVIGVLGLVATYATGGATGMAYEVTVDREYIRLNEQMCPDPDYPVPVFGTPPNRIGNMNKVLMGCISSEEAVMQEASAFRGARNRNSEVTSMYADHFTRTGSQRPMYGMLYAGY